MKSQKNVSARTKGRSRLNNRGLVFEADISTFGEEVLRSSDTVLVEFRAAWCSQCTALEPMLKSMANEKQGDFKFVTVDIDGNEALAGEYSVRAVPTLLLFSKGSVQETIVGKISELDLRQLLDRHR